MKMLGFILSKNNRNFFKFILIASLLSCCYTECMCNSISWDLPEHIPYLIHNEKCMLPNIPAFPAGNFSHHEQVMLPPPCSYKDLLTGTRVENNVATLYINENVIHQYYKSVKDLNCYYSYIERRENLDEPDVGINISLGYFFNSPVLLSKDTVFVKCVDHNDLQNEKKKNQPYIVYKNVHQVIRVPEKIALKTQNLTNSANEKPISVLFVVMDGVSRLNFERTMPLTRDFIMQNGFVEYTGYNKIHFNTFPNFIAWLTGRTENDVYHDCNPRTVGGLDKCHMIWNDFSQYGYATAYAEDWARLSTFVYLKKGFQKPPTDYYFKPYMEATDLLETTIYDTMPFCTGPESAGDRVLNLARDFSSTFKSKPSFGVFWMNTFSHNFINATIKMDTVLKKFYEDLKSSGVLDDSIVFYFSDHGINFGEILTTPRGYYEQRHPMNYISLPQWFKDKFPKETKHFYENSKKLTSTFDMYMTLQDILELSGTGHVSRQSAACPNCMSWFKKMPDERSCPDAGILEPWCTCMGYFSPLAKDKNNFSQYKEELTGIMAEISNQEKDLKIKSQSCDNIDSVAISPTQTNQYEVKGDKCYYLLITCTTDISKTYQILIKKYLFSNERQIVHVRRKYVL